MKSAEYKGNQTFLEIDEPIGEEVDTAIRRAIYVSNYFAQPVKFEFNTITITVMPDSKIELIKRDYMRAANGLIEKNVGPYPSDFLTEEEKKADEKQMKKN